MKKEIDFIITDIIMPELDGIGVIERIDEEYELGNLKKKPGIIIVSAIVHDNFKFDIFKKGVNYYMTKPINYEMLEKRIVELYDGIMSMELEEKISMRLKEIGIYPNLLGYAYIKSAVEVLIQRPEIQNNYRNELYPIIAEQNNKEVKSIEKSIINAINTAWNKKEGIVDLLDNDEEKPSANKILATLVEEMNNTYK
ncbi:MAG: sporulation initiation factor Spo0A C-terminal domain-containing protein, partial [Clostridia bacterium]